VTVDVNLFFLRDKILVEGSKTIHVSEIESLRDELMSGILVIRKQDEENYLVSMNKYHEEEVRKAVKRSDRNRHGRLYKLLGCREPMVIEGIMARLEGTLSPAGWNESSWLNVLSTGVYFETVADQNSAMLDSMVFKGRLQYETYATYGLSTTYMDNMLSKDQIYLSALERYLECKDEYIINTFMERHGYERKGKKFVKVQVEAIGFLL
jgi:hypothetical protein